MKRNDNIEKSVEDKLNTQHSANMLPIMKNLGGACCLIPG